MLFVSHQLEVMERLCDRVILMVDGRITGTLNSEEVTAVRAQPEGLVGWYLSQTDPGQAQPG